MTIAVRFCNAQRFLLAVFFAGGCARQPVTNNSPPTQLRVADHMDTATKPGVQASVDVSGSGTDADATKPTVASDFSSPRAAMDSFLRALRAKDTATVLACFSRQHPFRLVATGDTPPTRMRVTYDDLARGMKSGGDYIEVMYGDDDNLRQYAFDAAGADDAWRLARPATFTPSASYAIRIEVRWVKQGSRYVVDEIAFPF